MKILAVDTALGACSVAVLEGGAVRAHRFEVMARGHAEALAPMVEAVMAEAAMQFPQLDRLAVTTGPGTFTGQRVGLAFMRGLRVALKRPLIGVTTLEAMGAQAMAEVGDQRKLSHAAVAHDARRGEVYLQLLEGRVSVLGPIGLTFDAALAVLKDFALRDMFALAGTAAPRASAELADFVLSGVRTPDAAWVARLAHDMPAQDGPPRPLYLRAPDAKLPIAKLSDPRPFDPARDSPVTLASLHAACFDQSWGAEAINELLAGVGSFAFITLAGFVLARAAAGEAEILTLCVTPDARRRGLGRALLAAAARAAEARGAAVLFLEVSAANPAALALYTGAGFLPVGTRKAYYGANNSAVGDALVLKASLPLSLGAKFA